MTKVRHPNADPDKDADKARRRVEEFERARKPLDSDQEESEQKDHPEYDSERDSQSINNNP